MANFSGELDHTVVKTEFLGLKNGGLSLNLVTFCSSLHLAGLFVNELSLVSNPSLLDTDDLCREFCSLLLHVAELVLEGTSVLVVFATTLNVEVSELSVKLIDLQLLLGDVDLILFLELLLLFDLLLFGGTLSFKLLQFVLKEVILLLGVEVINLDTRDFIVEIFYLDFFLGDVLVLVLCLLE